VAIDSAAANLQNLLGQVVRLEHENVMFSQLITMLRNTRTLMRESEAGHLVNMTLSTLSRIVGNNRLALFPTTVLGSQRTYVRQVEEKEATELHHRLLEHLDPRQSERVQGRQARVDPEALCGRKMTSFSSATPWVLRDAGRTFLGMLYLFDNDPAQEDTLTHSVIRTIVVELERTLRRYLIEDDAAHAVIELPYRIWSREYWLRRFEEEIALTGRRGTRVACSILEILDYDRLATEMEPMMLQESVLTLLQVIKASVRETDLISRLGRNHFGLIFLDASKARVAPAIERMGTRLTRVVGGAIMAPRIGFVAGLAEFPWDGEGGTGDHAASLDGHAHGASARSFTVELYQHDQAEQYLAQHQEVREEIEVHLELLGRLELPEATGANLSPGPSER
jgi:GGDEF domain-containing protein